MSNMICYTELIPTHALDPAPNGAPPYLKICPCSGHTTHSVTTGHNAQVLIYPTWSKQPLAHIVLNLIQVPAAQEKNRNPQPFHIDPPRTSTITDMPAPSPTVSVSPTDANNNSRASFIADDLGCVTVELPHHDDPTAPAMAVPSTSSCLSPVDISNLGHIDTDFLQDLDEGPYTGPGGTQHRGDLPPANDTGVTVDTVIPSGSNNSSATNLTTNGSETGFSTEARIASRPDMFISSPD